MRVRAIRDKFIGGPPQIAAVGSPETDTFVTLGKEYEVYAMSLYQGVLWLQIVNDVEIIHWHPAWFFEIRDSSLPQDWICNLFEGDVAMVIGPTFIASDISSYVRMVELDMKMVEQFRSRIDNSYSRDDCLPG